MITLNEFRTHVIEDIKKRLALCNNDLNNLTDNEKLRLWSDAKEYSLLKEELCDARFSEVVDYLMVNKKIVDKNELLDKLLYYWSNQGIDFKNQSLGIRNFENDFELTTLSLQDIYSDHEIIIEQVSNFVSELTSLLLGLTDEMNNILSYNKNVYLDAVDELKFDSERTLIISRKFGEMTLTHFEKLFLNQYKDTGEYAFNILKNTNLNLDNIKHESEKLENQSQGQ